MILAIAVLAFVTCERVVELFIARRNSARLLARGAKEYSAAHYPLIVAVHVAWLGGLWLLAWDRPVQWIWLALFGLLQIARVSVFVSLGERWSTRILVLPGEALIKTGLYRYFKHPNYMVVIGEIATLPLAFGLPLFALIFSLLNGIVLFIRIRAEDAALGTADHLPV